MLASGCGDALFKPDIAVAPLPVRSATAPCGRADDGARPPGVGERPGQLAATDLEGDPAAPIRVVVGMPLADGAAPVPVRAVPCDVGDKDLTVRRLSPPDPGEDR
jgi:hypothetical protein